MAPWYKRTLSSEEALGRANIHLENAKKANDRRRAQKLCDSAKEALERMDISTTIKDQDQIIAAFRQHGDLLEKLGLPDEAQLSYSKADELSSTMNHSAPALPLATTPSPLSTSSAAVVTALTISSSTATLRNKGTILPAIFTKDCPPPNVHCLLPEPDERLTSTLQLAFCLALLQDTALPLDSLDAPIRTWLTATKRNQEEKDRLRTLATDIVRALVRDELKDIETIREVVCLASVLDRDDFQALLSLLVDMVSKSLLLDDRVLEGLAHMIQANAKFIEADDLVKILQLLSTRLQETFHQSSQSIYKLTRTVLRVLDAMADCNIQGLDRVNLHEPLLNYLSRLKSDKDPHIVYQAACAFQALLCVPDDEELWQAALRRSGTIIKGVGGLASAIKGLNLAEFINGLSAIQEGFRGADQVFGLTVDAYNGVISLKEGGQGLLESLKNGLSFSQKRAWYPALRGADTLIQNGELTKLKTLICEAPCRRDIVFQWGVCQRLGYLAADPVRDDASRKDAIAFLGEIYWNDEEWGQEPRIKQCILDVLLQLSQSIGQGSILGAINTLLKDLSAEGDENKRDLYQSCIQSGPSAYTWDSPEPHFRSSFLIDQIQSKPSVEPALRKYQRHRMKEQEQRHAVYIPPQAKPTRASPDDDLFDLTIRVKEFLQESDSTVLLLLGDSGAGKSTFNLELEKNLWSAYNNDKKWIPLFVTLPAINMPEEDLVGKHLRRYDFTDDQIRELKSYRQIVLICDGYDECQKKDNLYNDNRLNQPGGWNVKMVISCRSEYIGSDYRVFFQPGGRNDRKGAAQLQQAVVAPFSMTKINDYITSYVANYQAPGETVWTAEDYQCAIKRIPNLQDLVRNPFLLSLALEVLPRLVDLSKDLTSSQISRVTLYDRFVEQWVERGQKRLIERSKSGDDQVAFEILSEDGFTQNAIDFVKNLAVAIFDEQDGMPIVEYSPIRDKSSWKAAFFGHGDGQNLLRETCPLTRTGNQYRFIHRSILEYALARASFEPGKLEANDQDSAEQLDFRYKDNRDGSTNDTPSSSPLLRKSFVHEHSIINFLSERVLQSIQFKNQLHGFVERSKSDEQFILAAANSITILVQAGVLFHGANLNGIRVPGANLRGGQFDSALLQGADLRSTNLRNIWLRQADLANSQMAGVQFAEWPYLDEEHEIRSCSHSSDGETFAVGLDNGTINLYRTTTWEKTHTIHGHDDNVMSLVFSPSGRQIASGSWDFTVRLWDIQTGVPGAILTGHTQYVMSVAFSPSGQHIASGSTDMTVRLWDAQTGAPGVILEGHNGDVLSVVFSPSGQQLASGSTDMTVRLWDARTGAPGVVLEGHTHFVMGVVFSPNGQQIASGSSDMTVRLWDAQTGAPGFILEGHTHFVLSVVFSPSGQQIASGSKDNTVRLWDTLTGTTSAILNGHTNSVTSVIFLASGQQIASGSSDKTVRFWDAQKIASETTILKGHAHYVMSVVFSPCGLQIASGSWDKTVRLWDAQTGAPGAILEGHTHYVMSVVFSPSGQKIASGSCDKTVRLWDAQTGAPGTILEGHSGWVRSVAFSPNGQLIASGSNDKTVRLWDAQTGAPGAILKGHTDDVLSVIFSPSGQQIASGSNDMTIRLWDAQTGASGVILEGHSHNVMSVVYSPSGQKIASGSWDKTVRLWDAQTGAPEAILEGHTHYVMSVTFSPSGQQIASGSYDNTVRLWDAKSNRCLAVVAGFHAAVRSISWTNINGSYLVTGCFDMTVRLWQVMEDEGDYRIRLRWNSSPYRLNFSNTNIQNVQGLSAVC
ncbi:hypothetical protein EC968_006332 [Mortierella alpina]|nr:hypothetical protein EC968_006332 [Mortierella alpina]